jgi:hypothetical protein
VSFGSSPSGSNPSPFSDPGPPASSYYGPPPTPRKSSAGLWWGLGIGGAVLLLACGGTCTGLLMFGMNIAEEEIAAQLRDEPKFREHIGELQSLDMDLIASGAEDDDEVFVYKVRGSKGSGKVTIHEGEDDDGNTTVEKATLRLSDGTQVQVVP